MTIVGMDLGSRSVKIVTFVDDQITHKKIIDTAIFYREYCTNINGKIDIDLQRLGLGEMDKIVSTGYGKNNVDVINSKKLTELKAHVLGAMYQTKFYDFTLIDIGGQDSKVISVRNAKMMDMILNDKCAASCGRYLENMARVLGMEVSDMAKYSDFPVTLSSTCAVFAESELIGRISEGNKLENLAAGVNYSLFKRIKPLINKFASDTIIVTGGVAQNGALIKFIEDEINVKKVIVPKYPQLNAAIGCLVYASGQNSLFDVYHR